MGSLSERTCVWVPPVSGTLLCDFCVNNVLAHHGTRQHGENASPQVAWGPPGEISFSLYSEAHAGTSVGLGGSVSFSVPFVRILGESVKRGLQRRRTEVVESSVRCWLIAWSILMRILEM